MLKFKNRFQKSSCFVMSAVLLLSLFPAQIPHTDAAEDYCSYYEGTNVNRQNYSYWASPIQSYLSEAADGQIMRVQAYAADGHYLVEYYDADYNIRNTLLVEEELPIFGGFYASDSNYYVLSGQTNKSESASVECFRITKYDLNWNRLSSAGLYDCNTTVPFNAGCARFAQEGKYLLIRTAHEMYTSSDGLNHQANVTIQLDTGTMQITDSFTDVMNTGWGYVSHSFNQFIQIEDGHIIAVDHGDAYPRAIALLRYSTDVSTGQFSYGWNFCQETDLFAFPGRVGDNYTGASVGGFEISDSSYLVAFNSVDQDNYYSSTRNIYIAAMDKATSQVEVTQITDIPEGMGTASTPHLVKISDNEFILLWSGEGNVYYTKLNGKGDVVDQIYSIEDAALSDCVPTLAGNKLVWYTWNYNINTFYDIDITDLSKNNVATFDLDHHMVVIEYPAAADGYCTRKCTVCGYTETFQTGTSLMTFWKIYDDDSRYWGVSQMVWDVNTPLYYLINGYSESLPYNEKTISVTDLNSGKVDPEGVEYTLNYSFSGYFNFKKTGKYKITFSYLYNPLITSSVIIEVVCEHEYGSWTSDGAEQHSRACAVCGEKETVPHAWDNGMITKAATHTETGVMTYKCTVCGETKTETIPKTTEHHFSKWTSGGADAHTRTCECGETETAAHTWDNGTVTKAATHTETGVMTYKCTVCGETKTGTIPKTTEHHFSEWTSGGADAHVRSCECGETETAAHAWDNGTITKRPANGEAGIRTYTCTVCGAEKEETILVIPGDLDEDDDVDTDDALYLLMYTFFPDDYELNQDCDFDGNGIVDDNDALYLLMYVYFPDDYPLF